MSTEPIQNDDQKIESVQDDSTSNNSPTKIDKQSMKQKKKKTQALKNFLKDKTSQEIVAPVRKKSGSQTEDVNLQGTQSCRVCNKQVMKKKNCGFCSSVACNQHMRKKRKHPKTGKFAKICDDCQDKHLFQKYMKLQIKAEQALQLQQMIIATKHQEITEVLNGKNTKMTLLTNKRTGIDEDKRVNDAKLQQTDNQIRNKQRKLESKFIQLDKLEIQIGNLLKSVPRSLEEDHQALTEQNQKITKELVKFQKLCQEALKAKSKKEKDMYEAYYRWQEKQTQKSTKTQKKQDCTIY